MRGPVLHPRSWRPRESPKSWVHVTITNGSGPGFVYAYRARVRAFTDKLEWMTVMWEGGGS